MIFFDFLNFEMDHGSRLSPWPSLLVVPNSDPKGLILRKQKKRGGAAAPPFSKHPPQRLTKYKTCKEYIKQI